jgi:hypothetical protein
LAIGIQNMGYVYNPLTGQFDYHEGDKTYLDLLEITVPGSPAANKLRLFVEDYKGFSFFSFKDSGGMVRKIVRDSVFVGKNVTASTIALGRIVYASGSDEDVPTIALAKADSTATMPAIGVTIEAIAAGAFGRVMQVGLLENVNTLAYSAGDIFYVSAATAGIPTITPPTYPNIRQEIGTVLVDSATVGSIQIVARSAFNDAVVDHGGLLGLADDDHTQYTKKATLTTKGDIYAATGASVPARLAVGANDQVLTADSTQSTGIKWAAAAGGGSGATILETQVFSS